MATVAKTRHWFQTSDSLEFLRRRSPQGKDIYFKFLKSLLFTQSKDIYFKFSGSLLFAQSKDIYFKHSEDVYSKFLKSLHFTDSEDIYSKFLKSLPFPRESAITFFRYLPYTFPLLLAYLP